jgi:hypothetical protein
LAEDRDVAGVNTEICDILADPFERGHEIEHPGITRMDEFLAAELAEIQKPKNIEAVIDRHDDYITTPGQVGAGGAWRVGRSIGEGAAMKSNHNRAPASIKARAPQVQRQAVFADRHFVRNAG